MLGFGWTMYACMQGRVLDVTAWGRCVGLHQRMTCGTHRVQLKIPKLDPETTKKILAHGLLSTMMRDLNIDPSMFDET